MYYNKAKKEKVKNNITQLYTFLRVSETLNMIHTTSEKIQNYML